MQFRFTRDEEGTERIHVGDVCIASMSKPPNGHIIEAVHGTAAGLQESHVWEAIERADEAGFWDRLPEDAAFIAFDKIFKTSHIYKRDEVTVDVPVPETLTLVSDGEDQS